MVTTLWLKEIKAQVYTWKGTLWLVIAALLFSFSSYLMLTDKELSLLDQTELLWMLSKIIISAAFLIVAIDASSILATEFERETAESLFLSPVTLPAVLAAKWLASLTLWLALYAVALPYMIVTSAGTRLVLPFLGYVLLLGTLGIGGMTLLILGVSLLFRSSKNTLTTSLVILLALSAPALFSSTLKSSGVAQAFARVNPLDNIFSALDNVLVDYQVSLLQNGRYLWPLLLFGVVMLAIPLVGARVVRRQGFIKHE
jgi:ABC-type transport system involved in multi-copper enzyme maturation permease subunit